MDNENVREKEIEAYEDEIDTRRRERAANLINKSQDSENTEASSTESNPTKKEKGKRGRKPKSKSSVKSIEDTVQVSIDLPTDVHRKLRAIAGCTYKSARDVMVEFIVRGVKSFEQKNGEVPFWKL